MTQKNYTTQHIHAHCHVDPRSRFHGLWLPCLQTAPLHLVASATPAVKAGVLPEVFGPLVFGFSRSTQHNTHASVESVDSRSIVHVLWLPCLQTAPLHLVASATTAVKAGASEEVGAVFVTSHSTQTVVPFSRTWTRAGPRLRAALLHLVVSATLAA